MSQMTLRDRLKTAARKYVPKPLNRRVRGLGSANLRWKPISNANVPVIDKPLLVYLARRNEGLALFHSFIQSYKEFHDETPHDFLVIFKGFSSLGSKWDYYRALQGLQFLEMQKADFGLDIGSFRKAVEDFAYSYYLFLGSFCRIVAASYLANLLRCMKTAPRAGIVGPSGSWEPGISDRFPNYHVRTAAFMLRREVLLQIRWPFVVTKYDAYEFEHGERSVTRQIIEMGFEPYVVSAHGRWFEKERWPDSLTYRTGEQRALMIADKRTDQFQASDFERRRWLTSLSWGAGILR